MSTKQKYYVLENGEYVVKYKDQPSQVLKNNLSPEHSIRGNLQKYNTPKTTRNTASFNLETQPYNNKRLLTNRKLIAPDNQQRSQSGYTQYTNDKQPDERLCHITLQLTGRIKKLEEENEYLQQENKHFVIKLSFGIEKQKELRENIQGMEGQLEQVRCNYQDHMKMYNDLCVAYEGLAQENKRLIGENKGKDSMKTMSKTRSHNDSQHLQSVSEDGQGTFRTQNQEGQHNYFKIERYMFELDLLKHQLMDKDMLLTEVLAQLRASETNLNNSKLTEDFLITELEKTKAICYNQKLLEEALNEKIARILKELKSKDSIMNMCDSCRVVVENQKSINRKIEESKVESDSDENTS